jgi:hypothetical protein
MTARTETDLQPSSTTTHQPRAATKEGQGTILSASTPFEASITL